MKFYVAKIGKVSSRELRSVAEDYQKRLKPMATFESLEFKTEDDLRRHLKKISDFKLILLDERGQQRTSPELSEDLQKLSDNPAVKAAVFVIGGPYGFSPEFKASAHSLWSMSKGTFPNELAWLMVWEQLYRAFSILKGTGYHHDG